MSFLNLGRWLNWIFIFLLAVLVPPAIILTAIHAAVFDDSFYEAEFAKYGISGQFQNLSVKSVHGQVLGFLKGDTDAPPSIFKERESSHLSDVRHLAGISLNIHYWILFLLLLLAILLALFSRPIRIAIKNIGIAAISGGIVTLCFGLVVLALIKSDFSSSFEGFHQLFFNAGTYTFDPSRELIVLIYPAGLFMDLGILIIKKILFLSALLIVAGISCIKFSKYGKSRLPAH